MKSIKKLAIWTTRNELALPGKIRIVRLKCGKSTCKCQSGKESDKHGPYNFWDRKVNGRLTSTSIPKKDVLRFQTWVENRLKLEEIVNLIKMESEDSAKRSIARTEND